MSYWLPRKTKQKLLCEKLIEKRIVYWSILTLPSYNIEPEFNKFLL